MKSRKTGSTKPWRLDGVIEFDLKMTLPTNRANLSPFQRRPLRSVSNSLDSHTDLVTDNLINRLPGSSPSVLRTLNWSFGFAMREVFAMFTPDQELLSSIRRT